jgi:hypothetical protein
MLEISDVIEKSIQCQIQKDEHFFTCLNTCNFITMTLIAFNMYFEVYLFDYFSVPIKNFFKYLGFFQFNNSVCNFTF